ncbi:MAG TPA: ribonuclease HII [Melioribacteraceae bacterium]|nr:ribonuclease HII [Melioribacteraceae bacterium]
MNALKEFDNNYYKQGVEYLAGVDEVGRGPIAGPVVAAAVIFEKHVFIEGINDSKKLSENKRNDLYVKIIKSSFSYGYAIIDNNEIDKINILQASLKAMSFACNKLTIKPDLILIDGNKKFNSDIKTEAIIKGDAKSFVIAAASIVAKVIRDNLMVKEAEKYPAYNWKKNKGYPTKEHFDNVFKYGLSPLHRKTFLQKYTDYIPIEFGE